MQQAAPKPPPILSLVLLNGSLNALAVVMFNNSLRFSVVVVVSSPLVLLLLDDDEVDLRRDASEVLLVCRSVLLIVA